MPPRSSATTGITVTTASASDATKMIVITRPSVSDRRSGAHRPSARSAIGVGDQDAVDGRQVRRVALTRHRAEQRVQPVEPDDLAGKILERPPSCCEQVEGG